MTVHACTIIARNYLAAARVLARSFLNQHPDGTFSVLVIDDRFALVDDSAEPFQLLRLEDVGFDQDEAHRFAAIYDVMELATAVKPWLLDHLRERYAAEVVYLDPDIVVYAPLDELVEAAKRSELVLTPHATRPMPRDELLVGESEILAAGIYNLGFVAIGRRSTGFLEFWKERLRRECVVDPEHMRFVDQRWVDFAPGMFDVEILRDPGYNVAYWNLDHRELSWVTDHYEVEGLPLRFFHFSGYNPRVPELLSKHQGGRARILLSERPSVAKICREYAEQLFAEGYEQCASTPYEFSRLDNGIKFDRVMRRVYRTALRESETSQAPMPPNPFDSGDRFVAWLNAPATGERLSRYVASVYGHRPDLQVLFPESEGRDYQTILTWCRDEASQGRLDPHLVPAWQPSSDPGEVDETAPTDRNVDALIPGIRVAGYLRAEMGVGELGRLAVETVRASGIPNSIHVDSVTLARQRRGFTGEARGDLNVNLICINADELPHFAFRAGAEFFANRYNIGLWAWELEEFPERFDVSFEHVDEVWALSEFARKAIAARTNKPVHAFSLPVRAPGVPDDVSRAQLGLPDGYVFLFCFDLMSIFERKNPLGLIRAFTSEFRPGEGPTLVIKALNGEHNLADLERLRFAAQGRPDVLVLDEYLDAEENAALFAAADCYVSLHRSEGFGLTMAEAMALGKPVIATAYSGNLDFMTDDTAFLVPYSEGKVPKGCDPYPEGARWAEPDLEAAARFMRLVYEHPDEAEAVGKRARRHIADHHAPANRISFVRERFDAAQAALIERRTAREQYFAPLAFAEDGPTPESQAEQPSAPADAAPPPLIALAQQVPPIDRPSRHPRLARLFRRGVRRALRGHDAYQHELNMALARGTEHLARLTTELEVLQHKQVDTQRQQLDWLNSLKWRVDVLAPLASSVDSAQRDQRRVLDDLIARVTEVDQSTLATSRRFSDLAAQLGSLRRAMNTDHRSVEFTAERLDDLTRDVKFASRHLGDVANEVKDIGEAVQSSRELRSIPYMADPAAFEVKDEAGRPALGYQASDESAAGYIGFESIFRGSEDLIRERQKGYIPILEGHGPVVDLGSGRGEMLDLLREADIAARGVDLDESMVERARGKGHDVVWEDALHYLAGQPEGSFGAVFSAQFVEHLPYDSLVALIREARRVLRNDGLLVMETVNPYSIPAFRTFWTDLTHQAPIFPEVLLALTRDAGFPEARVIFPTGSGDLESDRWGTGEYAVIAYNGRTP